MSIEAYNSIYSCTEVLYIENKHCWYTKKKKNKEDESFILLEDRANVRATV